MRLQDESGQTEVYPNMKIGRTCASFFIVFCLVAFLPGCAESRYFVDRTRDAGDIVSLTAGVGLGAKARTGPIHIGLLWYQGTLGYSYGWVDWGNEMDFDWTAGTFEFSDLGSDRGKEYGASGGIPTFLSDSRATAFPFLSAIDNSIVYKESHRDPLFDPFYSQIEICGGMVGCMRLGVNPGELADFVIGWFGVDFFDDDIGIIKGKESE